MKDSVKVVYVCLAIILSISFNSCKEEEEVVPIPPEPTITFSSGSETGAGIIGEAIGIEVKLEAQAGLSKLVVTQDGAEIDAVDYTATRVSIDYNVPGTIATTYSANDKIVFQFTLTDKAGKVATATFTLTAENAPVFSFTITDKEIDGAIYKEVKGIITLDTSFTAESLYLLSGKVVVDSGANLTIEAGTKIYADTDTTKATLLIVSPSSTITAEGTSSNPIVFTSFNDLGGTATKADWVGIHINGLSTITGSSETLTNEIGEYGGSDAAHASGTLKYVRIEFAGQGLGGTSGGLNLNGVGTATVLDYIQVYNADGNGIRLRGGTARLKHIYIDNADGKGLRWDDGWTGFGQFWLGTYTTAPSGAVSLVEGRDAGSAPVISNVTLTSIGNTPLDNSRGFRFRDGTFGKVYNAIVTLLEKRAVRSDDTNITDENGDLVFSHGRIFNIDEPYDNDATAFETGFNNTADSVALANNYVGVDESGFFDPTTLDTWFDAANFVGAIPATDDWTSGWIR